MFGRKKRQLFIETIGSPSLKKPAEPIAEVNDAVRELAAFMITSMKRFNGIGIAAPQIGRGVRMVVIDVPADSMGDDPSPGEKALIPRMPLVLINPELTAFSTEICRRDEGCLSVPEIWGEVERPAKVTLRSLTLEGDVVEYECGGLLARCLQHEVDHLNGITFIDRMDKVAYAKVEVKVKNLRREGGRNNYRRVVKD